MANPAAVSDGDGEWLEIANLTSQSVDLQGLLLSDDGSNSHSIDEPVVIPAGGFAVLGANGDSSQNGGLSVDHVYDGTLGNSDDEIILSYGGVEIDAVRYSSSWVDSGASTALRDDAWGATSNDDAGSWCSSSSAYGSGDLGTPGTSNDCGSDEEPDPGDTGSGGSSGDCDGAQDWGVVINEFLANPAGSDDGYEWVEPLPRRLGGASAWRAGRWAGESPAPPPR